MAYRAQYECLWDSMNGNQWRVVLSQNDGPRLVRPRRRALGKAPVLKREQSENVWGTSLELFIQCDVEGEFGELYTSDPQEWLVHLYLWDPSLATPAWTERWSGYVVPELFSAPMVGLPYDVQVIATDGLGELKRHDFNVADVLTDYSVCSFRTCFDYLLNLTGLGYDVTVEDECPILMSTLGDVGTLLDFLDAQFDLSFLDGETCYDALQGLLRSMNAVVFRRINRWWVMRETDYVISTQGTTPNIFKYFDRFKGWHGTDYVGWLNVGDFETRIGRISNRAYGYDRQWPVNYMTEEIEHAARKVVVTNKYQIDAGKIIKDPYFDNRTATTPWTLAGGAQFDPRGVGVRIQGGVATEYVYQEIDVGNDITGDFTLSIDAMAPLISSSTGSDHTVPVKVEVKKANSSKQLGLNQYGEYIWNVPGTAGFTAGVALWLSSHDKRETLTIDFSDMPRNFSIKINGGVYNRANLRLYGVTISTEQKMVGIKAVVNINNNARNDDAFLDIPVSSGNRSDYILHKELILLPSGLPISSVSTAKINASKLVELVALDRTLQVAKPRIRLKGTLMTGSAAYQPFLEPLGYSMNMGNNVTTYFFMQTYIWDLYNDEMEVELLSVPDSSIVISEYSVTTTEES